MRMLVRMVLVVLTPVISDIISGPRSPITTKNAMQVPIKNPIIPISTMNLPKAPKAWKATTKI